MSNSLGPPAKPEVYQKEIKSRQAKASFVARGKGQIHPASAGPKPGGRCMPGKNFPAFRKATPASFENSYKYERMTVSASVV
jgi:hypothetical protein